MLKYSFITLLVFSSMVFPNSMDSTIVTKNDAPNIYIDCNFCDMNYIRTEINYVNYVIDRTEANVFIMLTRESTGSGGKAYELTLEGHDTFSGMQDTLTFNTEQNASWDETREEIVKRLKHGLFRYLIKTPLAESLEISFDQDSELEQPSDKWNYWVFRINFDAWLNGESSYEGQNFHEHLNAKRVTEDWKLSFDLCLSDDYDAYTIDDSVYESSSSRRTFNALIVKSLSDHLSLGFTGGANTSSYSNIHAAYWLNPTIEYNIYPYSESTRRELRFKYRVGYTINQYEEITVYDRTDENLLKQALDIEYELKQPWGSVELEGTASHYFHDYSKNRFDVHGNISWKIIKGLSFNIRGNYSLIHDQLSLPMGVATQEEILLHRKQLATQYNYYASMGLSYTFGSIYNNIVNPRF